MFWLCHPLQVKTGLSPQSRLILAGMHTLLTGTVHHAGREEMDVYLTLAAFTLCTEAAKVQWCTQVFSQSRTVQILPLRIMIEVCNFHHSYTLTVRQNVGEKILKDFTLYSFFP